MDDEGSPASLGAGIIRIYESIIDWFAVFAAVTFAGYIVKAFVEGSVKQFRRRKGEKDHSTTRNS